MVDLAAMRDAVAKQGFDPSLVNPKCPTDLIVDHSLQIDYSKWCVCIKSLHKQPDNHPFYFSSMYHTRWPHITSSQWSCCLLQFVNPVSNTFALSSAIQNAPNPGGGGGPNQSQAPPRSTTSRHPSRGGSHCGGARGPCSKAACSDPPASPGRPPASVQQIENTPLLCPFHLKPVSEWVRKFLTMIPTFDSHKKIWL